MTSDRQISPKLRRSPGKIQRYGADYGFVFSDNIDDWCGGSKKKKYSEKSKAKYHENAKSESHNFKLSKDGF